jgi:hypothetical protein
LTGKMLNRKILLGTLLLRLHKSIHIFRTFFVIVHCNAPQETTAPFFLLEFFI